MSSSEKYLSRYQILKKVPIWIIIHSVSGVVGYGVASLLLYINFPYSTIIGIIFLELLMFILKAIYYKNNDNLLCVRGIDNFAWTLSGIFFFIISLIETKKENLDSFSPLLRLPEFSGFIILAICIVIFINVIIPIAKLKTNAVNIRKQITRSIITTILFSPFIIIIFIILFFITCILGLIFSLSTFAIVISPLEIFYSSYQYSNILFERIIFGFVSTTWVGIVTGTAFIIAYPHILEIYNKRDLLYWQKNMPF
jgi:hypothetical protein